MDEITPQSVQINMISVKINNSTLNINEATWRSPPFLSELLQTLGTSCHTLKEFIVRKKVCGKAVRFDSCGIDGFIDDVERVSAMTLILQSKSGEKPDVLFAGKAYLGDLKIQRGLLVADLLKCKDFQFHEGVCVTERFCLTFERKFEFVSRLKAQFLEDVLVGN
jgi:hypothetical protein